MPPTSRASAARSEKARRSQEFDQLCARLRGVLVRECLALTGDVGAAGAGTREAFVVAGHHWRRVGARPDATDVEAWVRRRAWSRARRTARLRFWHRRSRWTDPAEEPHRVLAALRTLPREQREALVLVELTGLAPESAAAQLGRDSEQLSTVLSTARAAYTRTSGSDAEAIGSDLRGLDPLTRDVGLSDAETLRRQGTERRRSHVFAVALSLAALALLAGLVLSHGYGAADPSRGSTREQRVDASMLLRPSQLNLLAPAQRWTVTSTDDNTGGDGLSSVCQQSRFADPRGRGSAVRRFTTGGPAGRTFVQSVEVSGSPGAAERTYATTLDWYAGCRAAGVRLLRGWEVSGLGEEARVLELQLPGPGVPRALIGIARSGSLTVATLQQGAERPRTGPAAMLGTLTEALRGLCGADSAGPCRFAPAMAPALPTASTETRGTLAVVDLPVLPGIDQPWAGSNALPGSPNVASTPCDSADFTTARSPGARTRTYLVPQADLPTRFGLAETWGGFSSEAKAGDFVAKVGAAMTSCAKRNLGATVTHAVKGPQFALWHVDTQINAAKDTVGYWMGMVRAGRYVAQVGFAPAGTADVDEAAFRALMVRAGERLAELSSTKGSTS